MQAALHPQDCQGQQPKHRNVSPLPADWGRGCSRLPQCRAGLLGSRAETEPTQRSRAHYSQGVEPGVEPGMPGLHLLSATHKLRGGVNTGRALCQSGLWDETAPGTPCLSHLPMRAWSPERCHEVFLEAGDTTAPACTRVWGRFSHGPALQPGLDSFCIWIREAAGRMEGSVGYRAGAAPGRQVGEPRTKGVRVPAFLRQPRLLSRLCCLNPRSGAQSRLPGMGLVQGQSRM